MPGISNYNSYLQTKLEQVLPGIITRRYPDLSFISGRFIPAAADLEVGTQYLTKEVMDSFGEALIYSGTSGDIPIISSTIDARGWPVVTFAAGVEWSQKELDNASKAGTDPVASRTKMLPRYVAEASNKFLAAGSAKHGITGFLNNPDIATENSSYDASTATYTDDIAFANGILTGVANRTNLAGGIAYLLVPIALRNKWASRLVGTSSVTVLSHLLNAYGVANGGTLRGIVAINEVKSDFLEASGVHASGTNKDIVMALPVSPDAAAVSFNPTRALPLEGPVRTVYSQFYMQDWSQVRVDFPSEFEYKKIAKVS